MKIAFVTTCKGRLEYLRRTLPQNLADNKDAMFVVLDYGDADDLGSYVFGRLAPELNSGRLIYYRYETSGPFQVAHAKNMAARCAMREGADILVTMDADNFAGIDFDRFIADKFHEPGILPGIFLCPDFPLIHSMPHGPERPQRGYAGRLAIWAKDFLKLGGYDESFTTWRGEDTDMIFRLMRLGYSMRHIDNRFLNVIPHGADVRFKEYPHARQYENKGEVQRINARTERLVNFGKFGCGTVYRNFERSPVELRPVPTRIFGIGMHKTATSSLHRAFQVLDFDSFHWGEGQAPLIWHAMNTLGSSDVLEQYYALSDLPIPLLYEKLDKAYPGSKFILTVRDEVNWLRSVKRLWSYEHNAHRWIWDVYPFSNTIHTVLYGQPNFDALVFLARYRRHNNEVREYFKNRPEDLLVLDIEAGHGWRELCTFLGCPIPAVPFPWEIPGKHRDPRLFASY